MAEFKSHSPALSSSVKSVFLIKELSEGYESCHMIFGSGTQTMFMPCTIIAQQNIPTSTIGHHILDMQEQRKDLKIDAIDIFKTSAHAVHHNLVIESMLQFQSSTSVLKVQSNPTHWTTMCLSSVLAVLQWVWQSCGGYAQQACGGGNYQHSRGS